MYLLQCNEEEEHVDDLFIDLYGGLFDDNGFII
jgi:hypothetical protein